MNTVDIGEAKKHLSRLVESAVRGESFVIAKRGKPLVKVTAIDAPSVSRRLGFLKGQIKVPDDFDRMGKQEIAVFFSAGSREDAFDSL